MDEKKENDLLVKFLLNIVLITNDEEKTSDEKLSEIKKAQLDVLKAITPEAT